VSGLLGSSHGRTIVLGLHGCQKHCHSTVHLKEIQVAVGSVTSWAPASMSQPQTSMLT
jgi:hypothetical protein